MKDRLYTLPQIRALAELTQKETADLLGISERSYIRVEKTGKLKLEWAVKLAQAADIKVEQIAV